MGSQRRRGQYEVIVARVCREQFSRHIPGRHYWKARTNRVVSHTADIAALGVSCFERVRCLRSQLRVGACASQRPRGMAVLYWATKDRRCDEHANASTGRRACADAKRLKSCAICRRRIRLGLRRNRQSRAATCCGGAFRCRGVLFFGSTWRAGPGNARTLRFGSNSFARACPR
jgi:hypothetical protein